MSWKKRIAIDPKVLCGKPTIKGTRLSVGFLLGLFAEGWSKEQIFESYPQLQPEDLTALFAYSSLRIGGEEVLEPEEGTSG